jgi:hypothetical protein
VMPGVRFHTARFQLREAAAKLGTNPGWTGCSSNLGRKAQVAVETIRDQIV